MDHSSNEARLLLALKAIEKDPNLSIRAVVTIYKVSRSTLGTRLRGIPSRRDITANSRKLTDSEERAIVEYVLDLDSRAFSPSLRCVEDMANLLLSTRDASGASRVRVKWASKFVKRQSQLCTRLNSRIDN
jgi:hypothetical protein